MGKSEDAGLPRPEIAPVGDSAFLLRFGEEKSIKLNAALQGLAARIKGQEFDEIDDVIAAYSSLFVRLRPGSGGLLALAREIRSMAEEQSGRQHLRGTMLRVPVTYGGQYGPDLPEVARKARLSEEEVVKLHSSTPYYVYCLGFAPGFPYLGGLNPLLYCPRREEPRQSIPGGSVGIGGTQTGVYPQPGPGGWQLIGRTPCRLFAPGRRPPSVIAPGNLLRFAPVGENEYRRIRRRVGECGPDVGFCRTELDSSQTVELLEQIEEMERREGDLA